MHDTWFGVYHWMWREGVVGNIAASILLGVPSALLFWRKAWPKLREHLRKTHEIHRHLDASDPFAIGANPAQHRPKGKTS